MLHFQKLASGAAAIDATILATDVFGVESILFNELVSSLQDFENADAIFVKGVPVEVRNHWIRIQLPLIVDTNHVVAEEDIPGDLIEYVLGPQFPRVVD